MAKKDVILVVEDTEKCANWQTEAMHNVFPDKQVMHVTTLEDARKVLLNPEITVYGVLTDNGFPLEPNGERVGSKHETGGAGTLLIRQVRTGEFGEGYRGMNIVWHSADTEPEKVIKTLSQDGTFFIGRTKCFRKGDGISPYEEMGRFLKH